MSILNNASVSDRIAAAKALAAPQVAAKAADKHIDPVLLALRAETMPHPFDAGKNVKAMYFGEIFPTRGTTLMEWVRDNFVAVADHQSVLDEIAELKSAK